MGQASRRRGDREKFSVSTHESETDVLTSPNACVCCWAWCAWSRGRPISSSSGRLRWRCRSTATASSIVRRRAGPAESRSQWAARKQKKNEISERRVRESQPHANIATGWCSSGSGMLTWRLKSAGNDAQKASTNGARELEATVNSCATSCAASRPCWPAAARAAPPLELATDSCSADWTCSGGLGSAPPADCFAPRTSTSLAGPC